MIDSSDGQPELIIKLPLIMCVLPSFLFVARAAIDLDPIFFFALCTL